MHKHPKTCAPLAVQLEENALEHARRVSQIARATSVLAMKKGQCVPVTLGTLQTVVLLTLAIISVQNSLLSQQRT